MPTGRRRRAVYGPMTRNNRVSNQSNNLPDGINNAFSDPFGLDRIQRQKALPGKVDGNWLERAKDTYEYNKDMNRNMLLGLTAAFAAVTFAATSDFGSDEDTDKSFQDGVTSILTVVLVAILVIIVPLLHAYNMYEYGNLTGVPVKWWWYLFPLFLALIGFLPIVSYIVIFFL